jgi:hypothetical protein
MPSVAAAEAAAAMLVREDEEPLSQMPTLILDVDEMREGDIIVQLDGEMDDTIEDVAKGAIHTLADWTTLPNWAMWAATRSVSRWGVQPDTRTLDKDSAGDHP